MHLSQAMKHRVWNLHPEGGLMGLGIFPSRMMRCLVRLSGSVVGMEESSAMV